MRTSLLMLALLSAVAAGATTYYTSPTGAGDGTSESQPGKLSTMISALQAGDELILLDGQYDLNSGLTMRRTGKPESPVTIRAAHRRKAILDFRTQPWKRNNNGLSVGGRYMHIQGLVVRYAGFKGIYCDGSYNTLEDIESYGNCDSGFQMKEGGSNLLLNCDSHDNFDYRNGEDGDQATISGTTITNADFGGNADGFADKQHPGAPNTYIGCRSWNNSDDGWDSYQRVSPSASSEMGGDNSTLYIGCICYNNCPATFDLTTYARLETDKDWFDHFKDGAQLTVGGKTTTLAKYVHMGNGNGFKVGGKQKAHNVRLIRCLAVANKNKGFDQNNDPGKIEIYNCTGIKNGKNYGMGSIAGSSIYFANNVSYYEGTNKDSRGGSSYIKRDDNNTWNDGLGCSSADFESVEVSDATVLLPRLEDGSLPDMDLMKLKSTSKLVDAGVELSDVKPKVEYSGKAPDLGWYEVGGKGPAALPDTGDKEDTGGSGNSGDKEDTGGGGNSGDHEDVGEKAIGVVSATAAARPTRYFDLSGHELTAAPARGMYVEVTNGAGQLRTK